MLSATFSFSNSGISLLHNINQFLLEEECKFIYIVIETQYGMRLSHPTPGTIVFVLPIPRRALVCAQRIRQKKKRLQTRKTTSRTVVNTSGAKIYYDYRTTIISFVLQPFAFLHLWLTPMKQAKTLIIYHSNGMSNS